MTTSNSARKLRPADDQPFDLNLDTVKAEVELTPFRVHHAGRRYEFVHAQALDVWNLLAVADEGDLQAMVTVFKAALGDGQWEAFSKQPLPQYKLKALFEAYQKHSGLEPGESPGFAGS